MKQLFGVHVQARQSAEDYQQGIDNIRHIY